MRINKHSSSKYGFFSRTLKLWWAQPCVKLMACIWFFLLCLPLLVQHKPLVVYYQQQWYFPTQYTYHETVFGGQLLGEANYKDPVIQQEIERNGFMLWPLLRQDANHIDFAYTGAHPAPPQAKHWLGTDALGRDVLARLLYALRYSVWFATVLTLACGGVGILVGAVQGYWGGAVDFIGQRVVEVWSSLPFFLIVLLLLSVFQPTLINVWIAFFMVGWVGLVDNVRAEVLQTKNLPYIKAAEALGARPFYIVCRHILPNALVSSVAQLPFMISGHMVALATLQYLGVNLSHDANMGEMIIDASKQPQAPWLMMSVVLCMSMVLALLMRVGVVTQRVFNPYQSGYVK